VRLLDSRRLEVLEDHRDEVLLRPVAELLLGDALRLRIDQLVVLVDAEGAVRREALDRERTGDADRGLVFVGLVVEELVVGLRRDRGVDLLLACDPLLPPLGVELLGFGRATSRRRRGGSPIPPRRWRGRY
jgi:hypothetical protein